MLEFDWVRTRTTNAEYGSQGGACQEELMRSA
jgi:hypothetical protein